MSQEVVVEIKSGEIFTAFLAEWSKSSGQVQADIFARMSIKLAEECLSEHRFQAQCAEIASKLKEHVAPVGIHLLKSILQFLDD